MPLTKLKRLPVLLFPYDFTEVSDVAIEHAAGVARLLGLEIKILNILDPGTKSYMRKNGLNKQGLESKLAEMSAGMLEKYGVNTSFIIQNASIKTMCKIAEQQNVLFMMLGIDEPKRAGTRIMKVVTRSPVPVFIVQRNSVFRPYSNIFFPLDDFHGSRQKVGWTQKIAQATGAVVNIYSVNPGSLKQKEKIYRQRKVIDQCESFFAEHGIKTTVEIAQGSLMKFPEECLTYAEERTAELIIIMHRPRRLFSRKHQIDQKLIFNNSRIPVMCINLRDLSVGGGIT